MYPMDPSSFSGDVWIHRDYGAPSCNGIVLDTHGTMMWVFDLIKGINMCINIPIMSYQYHDVCTDMCTVSLTYHIL
jgi:hypothetical protein